MRKGAVSSDVGSPNCITTKTKEMKTALEVAAGAIMMAITFGVFTLAIWVLA